MWKWISAAAVSVLIAGLVAGADQSFVRIPMVPDSQLLHQVQPGYPQDARDAGIQGVVKLRVMIGKNGHVEQARLISGNRLLVPAALQAVRQRIYQPFESAGKSVRVVTEVDVPFTLP